VIIDCHAHISPPPELRIYRDWLTRTKGSEGKNPPLIPDESIITAMNTPSTGPISHMDGINQAGISIQMLSPRPNQMMHSKRPSEIVRWYTEVSNDLVYRYTQLWPTRFIGIASLPQTAEDPLDHAVHELRRSVTELGFKGCILNPDPYENTGKQPPPLWDPYWYPLYDELCALDVPCHVHGTGPAASREFYNHYYIHEESVAVLAFICSDILDIFPQLKVIASHGGGSIPFQIGRYIAADRTRKQRDFSTRLKRIYFDTVLHNPAAMEYLIRTVGSENCLFGTEWPGLGSVVNPDTNRMMDNLAPDVLALEWLSDADKNAILFKNAIDVFGLDISRGDEHGS